MRTKLPCCVAGAFEATVENPEFSAEMVKAALDVHAILGERIGQLV